MEFELMFERLVADNQRWLVRYVGKIVGSIETAEDIVQETFIRAFKAYDGYVETGRQKQWLRTIAYNASMKHLGGPAKPKFEYLGLALDPADEFLQTDDLAPTLEEMAESGELRRRILVAIGSLPDYQRNVVFYRYVMDYSVDQVAKITGQTPGSIKSKSFYGLKKIREILSDYYRESDFRMSCMESYPYLFQYAKKKIMTADKDRVEDHIAACEECRNIAKALSLLAPRIEPAEEGEMRHITIEFPLKNEYTLWYCDVTFPVDNFEKLNALLEKTNGRIPDDEVWFSSGHGVGSQHLAEFDNEGYQVEFEYMSNPFYPNTLRYKYTKMRRVYRNHILASVFLRKEKLYVPALEAPDLMVGKSQNLLGNAAKAGIYLAIPSEARNIRIKRGNGIIDMGPYKFAFSERYVAEDEALRIECSYLK